MRSWGETPRRRPEVWRIESEEKLRALHDGFRVYRSVVESIAKTIPDNNGSADLIIADKNGWCQAMRQRAETFMERSAGLFPARGRI
jgi:hypothetical protein